MNKLVKASIAGAAGVILLMGGAGTLAYWNGSAALGNGGQTITAGNLNITANTGAWTNSFNGGTATAGTPTLIVPGDTLTWTQTFSVSATGDHLLYSVTPTTPTVPAASGSGISFGAKLVATGAVVVKNSSGTVITPNSNQSYAAATGTTTITVTQTYALAFGTAVDNTTQNATTTLPTSGVVTLQQQAS